MGTTTLKVPKEKKKKSFQQKGAFLIQKNNKSINFEMRRCRDDVNDTAIVVKERKGRPPLIKHQDFTGTIQELKQRISTAIQHEKEAREFVKRRLKLIEINIEWCELSDNENEISQKQEELQTYNEEIIDASEGESQMRSNREALEYVQAQAEKLLALKQQRKNAATKQDRGGT